MRTCPFPVQVVLLDDELRRQLLRAFTEDDRLHVDEVARLLRLVQVRGCCLWRPRGSGGLWLCALPSRPLRCWWNAFQAVVAPPPPPTVIFCTFHPPAAPAHPPAPLQGEIDVPRVVQSTVTQLPTLARQLALGWSDRVLAS